MKKLRLMNLMTSSLVLALWLVVAPGAARAAGHSKAKVPSSDAKTYSGHGDKDKTVRVDPYQRRDGKWVSGHYRHESDTAPEKKKSSHHKK
jgi:hypothetical protein